jgi:hypothetical protein
MIVVGVRQRMTMRFQLILQFAGASAEDRDAMIALEEAIIRVLDDAGDVDGHDVGSGEMNVFILTDDPKLAFERIKHLVGTSRFMSDTKVAYREIGTDVFRVLFPPGVTRFQIS